MKEEETGKAGDTKKTQTETDHKPREQKGYNKESHCKGKTPDPQHNST